MTSPKLIWRVLKVHSGRAGALVTKKTYFLNTQCDHVLWGAWYDRVDLFCILKSHWRHAWAPKFFRGRQNDRGRFQSPQGRYWRSVWWFYAMGETPGCRASPLAPCGASTCHPDACRRSSSNEARPGICPPDSAFRTPRPWFWVIFRNCNQLQTSAESRTRNRCRRLSFFVCKKKSMFF